MTGIDIIADVFLAGATKARTLHFSRLELVLDQSTRWSGAQWLFHTGDGIRAHDCQGVEEISARGATVFPVIVQQPDGTKEEMLATGIMAGIPPGAHCLIYTPRFDGAWHGRALTIAFGRAVLRDCDYDTG